MNQGFALQVKTDYLTDVFEELGITDTDRRVSSPGLCKGAAKHVDQSQMKDLDISSQKAFRRIVGTFMWITPIRADIAYYAKEMARHLAYPKHCHWTHMKHLATYLHGSIHEACVLRSREHICWTDPLIIRSVCGSDHAGSELSTDRRSTSGVMVSINGFIIGSSSKTRSTVATSSGEADALAHSMNVVRSRTS